MAKGRKDGPPYGLSALEHDGDLWSFDLSAPPGHSLRLAYRREESARRAKLLIFRALADVVVPAVASRVPQARPAASPSVLPRVRQWIYIFLEEGQLDSLAGRIVEGLLVALIVANVAAVALETIPSIGLAYRGAFQVFERASLLIYSLEYLLRVWSCVEDPRNAAKGRIRGRLFFAMQPLMVVDFLAFAPSVLGFFFGLDLRVLRIFRLFRLLKLARYSQALQALLNVLFVERSALLASAILLLAFTCLTGELMYLVEGSVQPKTLGTMPGAMYWR
jgi:voltage-gated potassium channel